MILLIPRIKTLASSEGTMDSSSLAEQDSKPVELENIEISNQLGESQSIYFDADTSDQPQEEVAETTNLLDNEVGCYPKAKILKKR
jgi:hypothetical protein